MKTLIVIEDPPCGSERSCSGPRLAHALSGLLEGSTRSTTDGLAAQTVLADKVLAFQSVP